MSAQIQSPALLNTQGAYQLMADIGAASGGKLEIDFSEVRHVGAQALQILLCAKTAWEEEGQEFHLTNPSADFRQGLNALGAEDLLATAEAQA